MKNISVQLAAILTVLCTTQAFAAFSELGLKGRLQDVKLAYNWTCTGQTCNNVWGEEVKTLDALMIYVDTQIPDNTVISPELGRLAQEVSDQICGTTTTASVETLHWLVGTQNRAVRRLETLQKLSGIDLVKSCTKGLQPDVAKSASISAPAASLKSNDEITAADIQ